MILNEIKAALLQEVDRLWHYTAPANAEVPYAVWAEDIRTDFEADGKHAEVAWQGTVDYFTRIENDETVAEIEAALTSIDCAWYMNSIQYEQETGVVHYEWVWNG